MKNHRTPEERLERNYRRLMSRQPFCFICWEDDPRCLERHHIAGQAHHDDLITVCCNCHRKLSDQQIDHEALVMSGTPLQNIKDARYLLGLMDLIVMAAPQLLTVAQHLLEDIEGEANGSG